MIFTVNVTDWIQGLNRSQAISTHIWTSTLFLLETLRENFTTATFFIEYKVAKKYPLLVRKIANAGHEVACYVTPKEIDGKVYVYQIANTLELLESITNKKVIGIRTEGMTIKNSSFDSHCALLEKLGIKYDSSLHSELDIETLVTQNPSLAAFRNHSIDEYFLPGSIRFGGNKFRQQSYIRTHHAAKLASKKQGVFEIQAYDLGLNEYNHIEDIIDLSANQKEDFKNRKKVPKKLQKLLKDFPFDSFANSFYKV